MASRVMMVQRSWCACQVLGEAKRKKLIGTEKVLAEIYFMCLHCMDGELMLVWGNRCG